VHEALKQVLNRNAVKASYRCTPNIKNHVERHNANLLNEDNSNNDISRDRCNCQVSRKKDCPLPGRCSAKDVVYKATVQRLDDNSEETYGTKGAGGKKFPLNVLFFFKSQRRTDTFLQ
jgi:hypothetical protein